MLGEILDAQSRLAGRPIQLSDEVNTSEQTTNFADPRHRLAAL